ncbi:DEAD/DEAH box helicase [Oscillatoria sp. CS-180]|uniref:DEAD/DEAH box helicase n=1 Tax=Oscillatoria sp. CS-180 TaxID=3021720 RepID=UPI00232CAE0D|nr:DEAD/DEAH box helicase [Oscillatoria sp. CS-180]MDB9525222.1 DEAD/DEAH box helicase [Oscillatoria sp. CS-180]
MRPIFCGTSGTSQSGQQASWDELELSPPWPAVLELLCPQRSLRPVQLMALRDHKILDTNQNLIVSSPTNSGKTLVGWLILLDAVRQGKRAILLEPLRALARQMVDELERLTPQLSLILQQPISLKISTGDYRIEDELPFGPPPGGEILVATPERLEALLRNPANAKWFETVGAVCVDEAHLISSPKRGPTLEYLVTSLLCLPTPPRLALLSATLGNVEKAQKWLKPCSVVSVLERQPSLEKWVLALEEGEEANEVAIAYVAEALQSPNAQILIFVYQTQSTQKLAQAINNTSEGISAQAYHAQMSQGQREQVQQAFLKEESRAIVTTTALAMGMNLPATHVLIRDITFPGVGRLHSGELLQMMGRAGRGDQPGIAIVMLRPTDSWSELELVSELKTEILPEFASAFEREHRGRTQENMPPGTIQIAALLSRHPETGMSLESIKRFLEKSLGSQNLVSQVPSALRWLESETLAYQDLQEKNYHLTVLGKRAALAVLPLPLATGFARLMRDLMTIDPDDAFLADWRSLDHLLILDLLSEQSPSLRRYSAKLSGQIESWCEANPNQTPILFRKWIWGTVEQSRAGEVLGSLGIASDKAGQAADKWAHQLSYLAMLRVLVLGLRSQGVPSNEIERQYGIKNLGGIEERWRDDMLWKLSGLAKLLEIRTFYYHLKGDCQASSERIKRIKRCLRQMRYQTYELREYLKYCSPLGSLLKEMRRMLPSQERKLGIQSIRKLEESGIQSLKDLVGLDSDRLVTLGLRRKQAEQISTYLRRRMR